MLVVLITPPPVDEAGRKEYAQYAPSHIKFNRPFFPWFIGIGSMAHTSGDRFDPCVGGIDLRSQVQLF